METRGKTRSFAESIPRSQDHAYIERNFFPFKIRRQNCVDEIILFFLSVIFLPRLEIVIVVFAEKRKTLIRGLFESLKRILITLRFHRILRFNYYPMLEILLPPLQR